MMQKVTILIFSTLLAICFALPMSPLADDIVRPVEIKSKRQVIYDQPTYAKLARLWKEYHTAYPSEYAYANWMYAARYAGEEDYKSWLRKGLDRYPSNPTLLYLISLLQHGSSDDADERKYLEEAVRIDPQYSDPWFSLVIVYMNNREEELLDVALKHLLESGAISDLVLDYNYNTLIGLEESAILITNGDNDTYPAWVLTRFLDIRPDVTIVNRSLLNTEWYPAYLIEQGMVQFISPDNLTELRESTWKHLKESKASMPPGGLVSDTLIKLIVKSAKRAERPVYFSSTLYITKELEGLTVKGHQLGLATLVTPTKRDYNEQLREVLTVWVDEYRTAGIDSWRLRHASDTDADKMLVQNYASALLNNLYSLKSELNDLRLPLFKWYIRHLNELVSDKLQHRIAHVWACYGANIAEVDDWCKKQGITCPDQN